MKFTISRKLISLVAISLAVCAALITLALFSQNRLLLNERKSLVQTQVQSAIGVTKYMMSLVESGALSEEQAKQAALDTIGAMKYGNGDYIFVNAIDGVSLQHPNPKVVGQNLSGMKDANGVSFTADMTKAAKAGGGFVSYQWPRVADGPAVDKISYANLVPEWGWVIGTGVFMDDLRQISWNSGVQLVGWSAVLLAGLIAAALFIARSISRPINDMTEAMRHLADGDKDVDVPALGRGDEIGEMAGAVHVFKEAAIERDRLSAEAEAARIDREQAKERQTALDTAKAEDLRAFVATVQVGFERLSKGDLTVRMADKVAQEFEPIRAMFNESVGKLEDAIGSVVTSVGSIRNGLQEISTASSDLAKRTEQQAASLEGNGRRDHPGHGRRQRDRQGGQERPQGGRRRAAEGADRRRDRAPHGGGHDRHQGLVRADQRDHRRDRRNRFPDQSAGAECRRRGGACGRGGQGLRSRGAGSARAGAALGKCGQGDQGADPEVAGPGGRRRRACDVVRSVARRDRRGGGDHGERDRQHRVERRRAGGKPEGSLDRGRRDGQGHAAERGDGRGSDRGERIAVRRDRLSGPHRGAVQDQGLRPCRGSGSAPGRRKGPVASHAENRRPVEELRRQRGGRGRLGRVLRLAALREIKAPAFAPGFFFVRWLLPPP